MNKQTQWAIITGGAKGLGAEICKCLAAKGHNLLIHYNTSALEAFQIKETCREFGVKAECIQGDFSSSESVDKFLRNLLDNSFKIEILVNNAGNYCIKSQLETSDAEWQALFQTNLHAPVALVRALLPTLIEQRGAIINIGVAGINQVHADIYCTAYTASKLALWMTTRSLARELAPRGVRVNMVSPGVLDNSIDKQRLQPQLPMQRPGSLHEVARVVAFLLETESGYITGQNIEVAGGLRLKI